MKKTIVLLLAGLLVAAHVGVSVASLDGNERKGRYLFQQNCRPCHMENPEREPAGDVLEPAAKRQAEWGEVFENKEALPCYEHWDLSEQDVIDIHTYLHGGAADSPTPETCSLGSRDFAVKE